MITWTRYPIVLAVVLTAILPVAVGSAEPKAQGDRVALTEDAHRGRKAVELRKRIPSGGAPMAIQAIGDLESGASYRLSYWVKSEETSWGSKKIMPGVLQIFIDTAEKQSAKIVQLHLPTGTTDWTQYSKRFVTPPLTTGPSP